MDHANQIAKQAEKGGKVGFLVNEVLTKPRYVRLMTAGPATTDQIESAEFLLRDDLARGDVMLGTVAPILRHLLASDDNSIFGDEIIARVRGMTSDIARQLLQGREDAEPARDEAEYLFAELMRSSDFLRHIHALALEWQLTERLQSRLSLDPVLSPLLQALVGSRDGTTSGLAMKFLAAQARFGQSQRRMTLALTELPGDLLHGALLALRAIKGSGGTADEAEAAIRAGYDEAGSRLGLVARLVTGMGGGVVAALTVSHAGVAIFLSALALASGQDRDVAVLSTSDGQVARLTLALRAAGLKPQAVEEQFVALHPQAAIPDGIDSLGVDRAAAILRMSSGLPGN